MDVFELKWWRCIDGYEPYTLTPKHWVRPGQAGRPLPPALSGRVRLGLRSKSKHFELYEPFRLPSDALFRILSDTPATAAGMASFTRRFGLLRKAGEHEPSPAGRPTREAVTLDDHLRDQAALQRAVKLFEAGQRDDLTQLFNRRAGLVRQELRLDPNSKLHRVFVPTSLINGLWLQFAAHVESGAKLIRCQTCGDWFRVGTGTDRRETSTYCSNRCRQAAYEARRRDQVQTKAKVETKAKAKKVVG